MLLSKTSLGLTIDDGLNFDKHVQNKISKCNKIIGIVKWLSLILPQGALLTLNKMFIRLHLDYTDIIYDKPTNELFCEKLKALNIKAVLPLQEQFKEHLKRNFIKSLG